uniref:VQ domain-containing protein n=1 Tax=Ananas comosus var. bracteatus TaxID=296719 RepID=A0A6V7PEA8_ANACO|nr:unnamed protein product [Ananas comosus var. bracteatus]
MAANNYDPSLDSYNYWGYDSFENVALTRALQMSLSDATTSPSPSSSADSLPRLPPTQPPGPLTRPGRTAAAAPVPGPTGRVRKPKPRLGKKSATTYITADQENFREMVQRVTGIEPGSSRAGPAGRPEPSRVLARKVGAAAGQGWSLPTLDTSAFWLDRLRGAEPAGVAPGSAGPGPVQVQVQVQVPAFEFEPLPSFPTLESWGVM